jgi:sugar phosphate isomerase/epimerase
MIIALQADPKDYFGTKSMPSNAELLKLVEKAASMGFKAIQIGPMTGYVDIEGERLRKALDSLKMERTVHVGGIFDAESFATTEQEYQRMRKQIRGAVTLYNEIVATLVSVHPPFFRTTGEANDELLRKAGTRFRRLLKDEVDFVSRKNVKVAPESFCYLPLIFRGLDEFSQFIEQFPPEKLGILMDAGHLYQAGIDLDEAVHLFKRRLLDIHVGSVNSSGLKQVQNFLYNLE